MNRRILVVEDDEAVREAVEEALRREGLGTVAGRRRGGDRVPEA